MHGRVYECLSRGGRIRPILFFGHFVLSYARVMFRYQSAQLRGFLKLYRVAGRGLMSTTNATITTTPSRILLSFETITGGHLNGLLLE